MHGIILNTDHMRCTKDANINCQSEGYGTNDVWGGGVVGYCLKY